MSTRDACDQLGITLRTLYQIIDEGQLACYKFGRVYRLKTEDVEHYRSPGNNPNSGGEGVREPRRPRPAPSSGSAALEGGREENVRPVVGPPSGWPGGRGDLRCG